MRAQSNGIIPMANGVMRRIRRFRDDSKGVAAIEFALIVPIMIGLYIMLNETAHGMRAARKVTMGARLISDLITQATDVNNAYRDDVLASINTIMQPYSGSLAAVRITSIRFDGNGKGYVDWSESSGTGLPSHPRCRTTNPTSPPNPHGTISVPNGLKVANSSVVLAEVTYAYTPVIGYAITGTVNLADQLYTRPRTGEYVTRTGSPTTICPT